MGYIALVGHAVDLDDFEMAGCIKEWWKGLTPSFNVNVESTSLIFSGYPANASFKWNTFLRGGMRQTLLASVGITKPASIDYEPRHIVLPDGGTMR
ncbi:hypothetical protein FRC02_002995, partial [Tulasnella sp. 418]